MFSHRHPELPPLITEVSAPRLKDYLEKPRLVSTYGRRPSQVLTLPPSLSSIVADPDPGSGIRCLFDPGIRDPE